MPFTRTYCNPLPLPDYPAGGSTRQTRRDQGWIRSAKADYRETADPTALYHDGKWYLYPSCGMAYVSEDFVTWRHHRMEPYSIYAPTVHEIGGRFYLTGNSDRMYVSDNPLGPFRELGEMTDHDGKAFRWVDPMLFRDDDGQVYAYWGSGAPGIYGAEVDPHQPNQITTPPKLLIGYNPAHEWERYGNSNEDKGTNWNEGAWMLKHQGRYYLTYSGPGTEWSTYAMGVYVSDHPLGPFAYARRNPILRTTEGLVHGPGHGCIVPGPNGTLWAFYTCLARVDHKFERRVGVDPAGFDEEGNLFVRGASERPQWGPGVLAHPERGNDAGLVPATILKIARASSESPGRDAMYAVDNGIRTWWEAAPDDREPWLEVDLRSGGRDAFNVAAIRILWREPGLNFAKGVLPGPVGYLLEGRIGDGPWRVLLDRRESATDLLIDYRTFEPTLADRLRLTVVKTAKGIGVGVIEFTAFAAL
ncbi:MAG TPA: family 43 glycosylhydrolase [Fimbriimonas sp.]